MVGGGGGRGKSSPIAMKLKYLCLKNLADISHSKDNAMAALHYYLQAVRIDESDIIVWYRVGCLAHATSNLALARYALEKGLLIDSHHWLTLEKLLDVHHNPTIS